MLSLIINCAKLSRHAQGKQICETNLLTGALSWLPREPYTFLPGR